MTSTIASGEWAKERDHRRVAGGIAPPATRRIKDVKTILAKATRPKAANAQDMAVSHRLMSLVEGWWMSRFPPTLKGLDAASRYASTKPSIEGVGTS